LLRVMNNLINNAIQHSPVGSIVSVDVVKNGGGVTITVADSGSGIAPEALDQVFKRYYRGSHSRTRPNRETHRESAQELGRESEGSGLGLAISKAIAEAHGGSLEVKSPEGSGATFTLFLPAGVEE